MLSVPQQRLVMKLHNEIDDINLLKKLDFTYCFSDTTKLN